MSLLLPASFKKSYLFQEQDALSSRFSLSGRSRFISPRKAFIIGLILAIALAAGYLIISSMPNAEAEAAWSVGSQLSSIKADGNNVYVLWQNNSPDQNIYFKMSSDRGNSFGSTVRISNVVGSYPDSGFGFAADGLMAVPIDAVEENGGDDNARYVYIAWLNREPGAQYSKVLFRSSSDGGNSFGDPIILTDSNFKGDSGIQQLFASGNNVYAVLINEWADKNNVNDYDYYYDLVLRVSTDNGKTFSSPQHLIPTLPTRNIRAGLSINISPLLDSNHKLGNITDDNYQHNDALYLVWIDYGSCTVDQVTCEDIKILFRKSTDNGKTFSDPIEIERPKEALDYDKSLRSPEPVYLQVAGSSDGKNVYVVWAEYIIKEDSQRIFLTRSNDGGLTFTGPDGLSKSGISESPRLIIPPSYTNYNENTVYVAWKYEGSGSNNSTSLVDDIPQILIQKSSDGGNSFSPPVSVSPKMTMPFWEVAVSRTGDEMYAAWENITQNIAGLPEGNDVYFRASYDRGQTFADVLDLTGDNALKSLLAAQQKALSFVEPQIAMSPNGNSVYVAWQASYPDSAEINVRASSDGGHSFDRIITLNDEVKDPVSRSIAAGSSNPFFGQILTPVGLTISGVGVAVAGIAALMMFHRGKRK